MGPRGVGNFFFFFDSYSMKLAFSTNLQQKNINRMKGEGMKREKNVRDKQVISVFP